MRELIPLMRIFIDLSECFEVDVEVATAKCPVFEDNSSAIQLANVPKMTPRLKPIALHYHFSVNTYRKEASVWNMYRRICR